MSLGALAGKDGRFRFGNRAEKARFLWDFLRKIVDKAVRIRYNESDRNAATDGARASGKEKEERDYVQNRD